MSLFDGKPIGRIDLSPKYDHRRDPALAEHALQRIDRLAEGERYWRAIRATAEGTNITTPTEDA